MFGNALGFQNYLLRVVVAFAVFDCSMLRKKEIERKKWRQKLCLKLK